MSLYRTYRPATLGQLIGQEHIQRGFLGALARHQLAHAYLFTGPRGTGKTSTARIIARAINCENPAADGEPCNECSMCTDALAGRLTDLIEIDAASNRGIDEIRELKETISFAPSRGRAKVYIIDEVHMLTKEAFNALLKTLEEPPAHAYFILATTEVHKVPETIISRCQRFDFHRIRDDAMTQHLAHVCQQESITAEPEALVLIARQSAGGLRDALSLLDQLAASGEVTVDLVTGSLGLSRPVAVDDFVQALLSQDANAALTTIDGLVAEGANLPQFTKAVLMRLRELMLVDVAANQIGSAKHLISFIELFQQAGDELKTTLIPQLPLETAAVLATSRGVAATALPKAEVKHQKAEKTPAPTIQPTSAPASAPAEQKPETSLSPLPSQAEDTLLARGEESEPVILRSESQANVSKEASKQAASTVPPESTPQPALAAEKTDVTEADARRAFAAAQKNVTHAGTKMALKEARFMSFAGGEITAGVASDFYLNKLNDADATAAIAEAITAELGSSLSVSFIRSEATDLPTPAPIPVSPAPAAPAAPQGGVDLAKHAEDLFAGDNTF